MQVGRRGGRLLRARVAQAACTVGGLGLALVMAGASVGCRGKSAGESTAVADAAPTVASARPAPSAPMNATPLRPEVVARTVNPKNLPAYSGPTGSVEGTVHVEGPPSPDVEGDWSVCPDAQRMYGKLFREGAPAADGSRPLADAVVGVTGYSGYYLPERTDAKVATIESCGFTSRTVTMTFGQRLEVKNNAKDYWAPVVEQLPMPALMLAPPNGEAIRLYPEKAGHFTLEDRMKHRWAKADLYVLLQPLHAVSDEAGHFRIDNVPVGKLKVSTRLTAIGEETTKDVEVLAGVVQKVDLVLKYVPKPPSSAVPGPPTVDGGRPREGIK